MTQSPKPDKKTMRDWGDEARILAIAQSELFCYYYCLRYESGLRLDECGQLYYDSRIAQNPV